MSKTEEIRKAIELIGRQPVTIIPGTVKSVNESAGSCEITDQEGLVKYDVRIKAAIDDQVTGLYVIPSVGSSVLIGRIQESNEWVILAYTNFDKVIMKHESSEFVQDDDFSLVNEKCEFRLSSKITIKNDQASIKELLNDILTTIKSATAGPYNLDPKSVADLTQHGQTVNNLFD